MGHVTNVKDMVYRALAERLSKNPVGVKINETLLEILRRLYSESEAAVGSKFPLTPVPLDKIAAATGFEKNRLKKILDEMAEKGLVLDIPRRSTVLYMLAPMVIGFFEYTFMRTRDNVDMKELAALFEIYFQDDGVREELSGGETKMFKAMVYERLIPAAVETEVLSWERAAEIIVQSGGGVLSMCSCRHKAGHLGRSCGAPLDVCMSLGKNASEWLVRRGLGRAASVDELLQVLDRTEKAGLVHLGDNVLNNPTFICHCCGCCCTVLKAIRESGKFMVHPSNFIPQHKAEQCAGCGACADSCHTGAITMRTDEKDVGLPCISQDLCIGCGVCAAACPREALAMSRRAYIHVPPQNSMEKFSRIAGERGRSG